MGVVTIDNLTEGMVLADNINDRSGRLLLNAGTELTTKQLRMLRTWGVPEADIIGIDTQDGVSCCGFDEVEPERLRASEEQLRFLFRNVKPDCPVMGELFRLCLLRKVLNENR